MACKKICRFVLYFLLFGNCSLYSVLGIFPILNHLFLICLVSVTYFEVDDDKWQNHKEEEYAEVDSFMYVNQMTICVLVFVAM